MSDEARLSRRVLGASLAIEIPGRLSVCTLAPALRLILRGGTRAREVAGEVFGLVLPTEPCRAATAGDRAALWLGPDEWLLIGPETNERSIAAAITGSVAPTSASLVDVSHQSIAIEVSGPKCEDVLAAGCPLDVAPEAFPVGMCTRTLFGKAEIVLCRTGPRIFRIEAWCSFAPYVLGLVTEAARQFEAG